MKAVLLIKAFRGSLVEREHYGHIVLTDNKKILSEIGDSKEQLFFTRSCAKPFQAFPLINSGAFETLGLNLKELAVCCGSHTGTDEHTTTVESILKKAGLNKTALKCGIHPPLDEETKTNLIKQNKPFTVFHNNCSGKHAGMLAVCVHKGWNIENYLNFDHPLQKEIMKTTQDFCNISKPMPQSLDGCKAPVSGMELYKMGLGYLNLFADKDGKLIKEAFLKHPFLIGGNGRLDTEIIKASNGKLIAKVGAEGLCIVVNTSINQALIVKILDSNMPARSIAVIEALKQKEWLTKEELKSPNIQKLCNPDVKTWDNTVIGSINPVFCLK